AWRRAWPRLRASTSTGGRVSPGPRTSRTRRSSGSGSEPSTRASSKGAAPASLAARAGAETDSACRAALKGPEGLPGTGPPTTRRRGLPGFPAPPRDRRGDRGASRVATRGRPSRRVHELVAHAVDGQDELRLGAAVPDL